MQEIRTHPSLTQSMLQQRHAFAEFDIVRILTANPLQQASNGQRLFAIFQLRWQVTGIFQQTVTGAEFSRHRSVIFQRQRLALAGQIVELAFILGIKDMTFRPLIEQPHDRQPR